MSYYENMSVEDLAKILTHGARKACLKLTGEWKSSKEMIVHHNGVEFLHWQYQNSKGEHLLCEKQKGTGHSKHSRINNYRLTALGLKVKERLLFLGEE